jgi:hypothetical protein
MPDKELEEVSFQDISDILGESVEGEKLTHIFEVNEASVGDSVRVIAGGTIYNVFMAGPDSFVLQEIKYVPSYGKTTRIDGASHVEKFLSSLGEWEELLQQKKNP